MFILFLREEFKFFEEIEQKNTNLLEDPSKLNVKFNELEDNILKLMEKKQQMEKEFEQMRIDHKKLLGDLDSKEKALKSEYNLLVGDREVKIIIKLERY